jgi:hypothetical protein
MHQFTVSVKLVVCDSDPDVAVTAIVEVTGWIGLLAEDTPHPLSKFRPAMLTASSTSICKRRRFFQPKQTRAAVNPASGNSGLE